MELIITSLNTCLTKGEYFAYEGTFITFAVCRIIVDGIECLISKSLNL